MVPYNSVGSEYSVVFAFNKSYIIFKNFHFGEARWYNRLNCPGLDYFKLVCDVSVS